MRSGLITEATLVGGSLFVVGAALMQFRRDGITDKQYWPYLGVFITGFSAHLIFEAFGLNKKYCETAFQSEVKEEWGEEVEWDEDADEKGKPDWRQDVEWDAESKDEARMKKYEKTYGKEGAKVRNRIFKRILAKAQDGTKAGQWSARKAQSLTESYEKAMKRKGKTAYKGGKKTKSQKSLKKWGDQKWTTKSGKKSSKTGERYLPEKAIKALSDKEYKETSDKKRKDTKKGKQFSKQPQKVADKVKKYRADDSWKGGQPMWKPKKGWANSSAQWKRKQQKRITEFEKEMIWVENMLNQNRYYCKRYEDIPYLQRKTFSGKNLRRGNRCYNCRSKECPSTLLSWKQAHRLADEADDRRAKKWGIRDDLIESGEYPEYLRKDRDSILKDLFGAEGDIPYGVHVQNYKTTSTVFYKRKPFRKYRGNRHREQAQAYASFMESKLKRNPRYFNYYAESFEAEGKPTSVEVKRSTNDEKKLMAVFTYPDERTKTTHFGQRGASDYTKHGEQERMERYLERHGGGTTTSTKEDWKDPTTAGALSRWILWNKPSLSASFNDFKKRFNLKGELKVSKSAESFESETVAFESFRGRWNVGQTREIEGVRVKKMRNGAFKLDFQGESIIIYDGQFYQINRNERGGFSMGRYDGALNGELLRSGYSEKDVPDNMEAIIRWKHRVGGGRLVIRSPFKKARHIFAGGLYNFTLPGQEYRGVFYPTNRGKTYRFIRRNGEPIVGRFPKKNEAWLDIRYDAESFEAQFTPSQELSDYTPEEIVESSAIDGFQPSKFSVMGNRAETFEADSCRECGRKEGPYSDTVLIACKGCPELSCQHCLDEENNGCAFCIKKRAESTSKGLNLVMMGVPGSGKGTQSKLITKAYGWPQIGMGDLIRDNMRKKTPLGVKCEPYMAKGSLVPDEIMIELVSQRLKEDDCKNGFILDGFPRTVPQGKALEKITNIDAVFFLDTKKEVVIERLGGRRTCSDCGEIFHQLFQPPQQEGTCDLCKGELFIRPDDNPKTISNRLSVFKTKTQPLIDFYEQRNILRPIQSNSTPQDVFESIDGDIQSMLVSGDITALEAQDTPYCNYHTQLVLGAENALILGAEHYTDGRPMTCPICIKTLSQY